MSAASLDEDGSEHYLMAIVSRQYCAGRWEKVCAVDKVMFRKIGLGRKRDPPTAVVKCLSAPQAQDFLRRCRSKNNHYDQRAFLSNVNDVLKGSELPR